MLKSSFWGKKRKLENVNGFKRSPVELIYQRPEHLIVSVPVDKCRMNFTAFKATENPFVKMMQQDASSYEESILHHYYTSYVPLNVGELLGTVRSRIADLPSMSAVMPWWNRTPDYHLSLIGKETEQGMLSNEAIKFGASLSSDFGWQFYGPVSNNVGRQEFDRQLSVYRSILEKGFQPKSYRLLYGEFLVNGNDWIWVSQGGKHRFNALVALGHEEIVVCGKRVYGPDFVRREDVDSWPNVMNGWFTRDDALQLFDRFIEGQPSSFS